MGVASLTHNLLFRQRLCCLGMVQSRLSW